MTPPALPSLFLSHGSPMLALQPGSTGRFLQQLGPAIDAAFGRPKAILAISAHTLAHKPVLSLATRQQEVHDYRGFPAELYQLSYRPPGSPELGRDLAARLASAGWPVQTMDSAGLDHGIWSMLRFIYPEADVPVLPLAWMPQAPPEVQMQFGAALAPLNQRGVLVLGTGSITHNLGRIFGGGRPDVNAPEVPESRAFRDWMAERSAAADWQALCSYREQAPFAQDMHPTDEHLLPWFVAAGAAQSEAPPLRLHQDVSYGCLGMDAYAFGENATRLLLAAGRSGAAAADPDSPKAIAS